MKRERDCPPYNDETPEEFMLSSVFGLEVTQEQIDKRRQKLEDQKTCPQKSPEGMLE